MTIVGWVDPRAERLNNLSAILETVCSKARHAALSLFTVSNDGVLPPRSQGNHSAIAITLFALAGAVSSLSEFLTAPESTLLTLADLDRLSKNIAPLSDVLDGIEQQFATADKVIIWHSESRTFSTRLEVGFWNDEEAEKVYYSQVAGVKRIIRMTIQARKDYFKQHSDDSNALESKDSHNVPAPPRPFHDEKLAPSDATAYKETLSSPNHGPQFLPVAHQIQGHDRGNSGTLPNPLQRMSPHDDRSNMSSSNKDNSTLKVVTSDKHKSSQTAEPQLACTGRPFLVPDRVNNAQTTVPNVAEGQSKIFPKTQQSASTDFYFPGILSSSVKFRVASSTTSSTAATSSRLEAFILEPKCVELQDYSKLFYEIVDTQISQCNSQVQPTESIVAELNKLVPAQIYLIQAFTAARQGQIVSIHHGTPVDLVTPMGCVQVYPVVFVIETPGQNTTTATSLPSVVSTGVSGKSNSDRPFTNIPGLSFGTKNVPPSLYGIRNGIKVSPAYLPIFADGTYLSIQQGDGPSTREHYMTLTTHPGFMSDSIQSDRSLEEIRLADYEAGLKGLPPGSRNFIDFQRCGPHGQMVPAAGTQQSSSFGQEDSSTSGLVGNTGSSGSIFSSSATLIMLASTASPFGNGPRSFTGTKPFTNTPKGPRSNVFGQIPSKPTVETKATQAQTMPFRFSTTPMVNLSDTSQTSEQTSTTPIAKTDNKETVTLQALWNCIKCGTCIMLHSKDEKDARLCDVCHDNKDSTCWLCKKHFQSHVLTDLVPLHAADTSSAATQEDELPNEQNKNAEASATKPATASSRFTPPSFTFTGLVPKAPLEVPAPAPRAPSSSDLVSKFDGIFLGPTAAASFTMLQGQSDGTDERIARTSRDGGGEQQRTG
ncbi:hypothetical protein ACN47E_007763 [Coniothyrium glycines]